MENILQTTCSKNFFVSENRILTLISWKCVPNGPIDNKSAWLQVMAWYWKGNNSIHGLVEKVAGLKDQKF